MIFFASCTAVVIIAGFVTMGVHKGNGRRCVKLQPGVQGRYFYHSVEFNERYEHQKSWTEKVVPIIEVESATGSANVQTQTGAGLQSRLSSSLATLDVSQREELNSRLFEEEFGVDPEKITAETISSTIS